MKVYLFRYSDLQNPNSPWDLNYSSRDRVTRSATIGSFDGLHLGHQKLSSLVMDFKSDLKSVITFYPHPSSLLSNRESHKPIYSLSSKVEILKNWGFDELFILRFNPSFLGLSPESFISNLLISSLNIRNLVLGSDWKFGKKGEGNIGFLNQYIKNNNLKLNIKTPDDVCMDGGRRVSSGWLRELIHDGNINLLNQLLGRKYYVLGLVSHGDDRGGSLLGIKTANLHINSTLLPKIGVYAALTEVDGIKYNSVVNIGTKPTFKDSKEVILESHIIDVDKISLYGRKIKVFFIERIRDEIKFEKYDNLILQIKNDIEKTKQILQ